MVEEIYLKGFRGIAEGVLDSLTSINILVGPNNVGKSTILEALYLAATTGESAELGSVEGKFYPVFIPSQTDMLGLDPLLRMWMRHGFPRIWSGGKEIARWDEGNIRLKLPGILSDYPLLTSADPLEQSFPQKQAERMTMLAYQLKGDEEMHWPPLESYFSPPWEGKRFLFTWFKEFIYRMRGLGMKWLG